MNPGRALDAEVAEKVLGCKILRTRAGVLHCGCDTESILKPHEDADDYGDLRSYSTDIAAAWEVVEHMRAKTHRNVLNLVSPEETGEFYYVLFSKKRHARILDHLDSLGYGESAPHAICLAALKATQSS